MVPNIKEGHSIESFDAIRDHNAFATPRFYDSMGKINRYNESRL